MQIPELKKATEQKMDKSIQAFKAETGEPAWKTFVIPGPGEPGHETWPGETWKAGGGST